MEGTHSMNCECDECLEMRWAVGSSASACWTVPGWTDFYGNIKCAKCGKVQSPTFKACIVCCLHNTLDFTEYWHGSDECGGWHLGVECADCGKNFDFDRDDIIANYMAVRRKPNHCSVASARE